MGIACLRLSPAEFWDMLPGQYFDALTIYYREKRSDQRFIAELFRMQTTDLLNIQIKKSQRLKPGELWRFPWDDDDEADEKPMTDDEIRKHNEEIMKRFSNGG